MFDKILARYRTTFGQALCGSMVLWAALPPLDWWWLGWIAPVWWVMLARREELAGKRPYATLWLAGCLFWLAAYHFLRLPHWATSFGWVALAVYQGLYLPLFVGLTRVGVHRMRIPLILAAPIVWTGLELARGHVITGITMASLGHTQYRWIELIQLSDLAGAYGVSFVVMFVAACLARMLPRDDKPWVAWPLTPGILIVAAAIGYGHFRLAEPPAEPVTRIALIQGSIDSQFKADPEKAEQVHRHYHELSEEAIGRFENLDLIVWPETMFRGTLLSYDEMAVPPPEWESTPEEFAVELAYYSDRSRRSMIAVAKELGVPMLLGVDTSHYTAGGVKRFNSAVLVTPDGQVADRYDKMHRVLFGEYVPFADWLPWLHRLTPLSVSLSPGVRPVAFELDGLHLAPSICYENVLPHVIRRQVVGLRQQGIEPDVLVNLTNDGWFWGSSELDMHLICGVFRAVECGKPMLIAANTGFSAWIDADGRIRKQGLRRDKDVLLAEVGPHRRASWYSRHGDWPAGICLVLCGLFALVGWRGRKRWAGGKKED